MPGSLARHTTLLKKRLRYFPVNFVKFLRTSFFTKHLQWLSLSQLRQHQSSSSININHHHTSTFRYPGFKDNCNYQYKCNYMVLFKSNFLKRFKNQKGTKFTQNLKLNVHKALRTHGHYGHLLSVL